MDSSLYLLVGLLAGFGYSAYRVRDMETASPVHVVAMCVFLAGAVATIIHIIFLFAGGMK